MKKWFYLFLSLPFFFSSCKKSNRCGFTDINAQATAPEFTYIENYLASNSIAAIRHSTGVYYFINDPGSGTTASVCSNITVNYTGTLLSNGVVFDSDSSAAGVNLVLGQLIVGWQKGIPLIRSGGSITLYIPPSLGYGVAGRTNQYGVVVVPANAYLKFTIHLLDVQ